MEATYSSWPQKYSTTELRSSREWTKLEEKRGVNAEMATGAGNRAAPWVESKTRDCPAGKRKCLREAKLP